MGDQFYRLKKGRVLAGVLAGLSDKYHWDLNLVRAHQLLEKSPLSKKGP